MAALLAVLVPVVVGFVVVTALWPAERRPDRALLLKACLAFGWGVGVSSWTFFLWLVVAGSPGPGLRVAEAVAFGALLAGFGVLLWRSRSALELPRRPVFGGLLPVALGAVFVLAVVARAVQVLTFSDLFPHGEGDAYFIWNMKARFLYRAGEDWRLIFAFPPPDNEKIPLAPADYPLLLPATVARLWWYAGEESTREPALIALVFTVAAFVLLYAAVTALRGRSQGAIAAIVLTAAPFFTFLGSTQVVDVPLSFYMLAAVTLFALHDSTGGADRRWVVLAGMMAGLAGWAKNEGLLFIAVLFAVRLLVVPFRDGLRVSFRETGAFLVGLLPFVCLLLYYRVDLVPAANYLLAAQGDQTTLDRLRDGSRYITILLMLLLQLLPLDSRTHWTTIGWILLLAIPYRLLLGGNPARVRRTSLTPLLVVFLMMLGYIFVYLTTPLELKGHLRSSMHRVMMHVWPIALLWFFLTTATPEEALAREPTAD